MGFKRCGLVVFHEIQIGQPRFEKTTVHGSAQKAHKSGLVYRIHLGGDGTGVTDFFKDTDLSESARKMVRAAI